jgi:hypothetical protein
MGEVIARSAPGRSSPYSVTRLSLLLLRSLALQCSNSKVLLPVSTCLVPLLPTSYIERFTDLRLYKFNSIRRIASSTISRRSHLVDASWLLGSCIPDCKSMKLFVFFLLSYRPFKNLLLALLEVQQKPIKLQDPCQHAHFANSHKHYVYTLRLRSKTTN